VLVRAVHRKARRQAARLLMGGVCDQCTSTSELPALSETTAGKTTLAANGEKQPVHKHKPRAFPSTRPPNKRRYASKRGCASSLCTNTSQSPLQLRGCASSLRA